MELSGKTPFELNGKTKPRRKWLLPIVLVWLVVVSVVLYRQYQDRADFARGLQESSDRAHQMERERAEQLDQTHEKSLKIR